MSYLFWLGASTEEADQALAVPVEPHSRLAPSGFDPSRGVRTLRELREQMRAVARGERPSPTEWR